VHGVVRQRPARRAFGADRLAGDRRARLDALAVTTTTSELFLDDCICAAAHVEDRLDAPLKWE
jgi:hypothetical protein